MIHDAEVEVTCDGDKCFDSIRVELPYRYTDLSGKNGQYDHRPKTINRLVEAEGWTVEQVGEEGRHLCQECADK